ncbi:MAG: hypothetical protein KGI04_01690 [Candidatus Micrarchaeota archaeon]|nr:hypothetical protein [Candidatus Micrarchaeota archaeon]
MYRRRGKMTGEAKKHVPEIMPSLRDMPLVGAYRSLTEEEKEFMSYRRSGNAD